MMEMAVPRRRKRGKPRRRWMDLAREDLKSVGAKKEDEIDRVKWTILSRCGDPERRRSALCRYPCITNISNGVCYLCSLSK